MQTIIERKYHEGEKAIFVQKLIFLLEIDYSKLLDPIEQTRS